MIQIENTFGFLIAFENMIKLDKVDTRIIKPLNKLNKEIINEQQKILKLRINNRSKFILFHSTDLQNKFLVKLMEEIKFAKQRHENPKTIHNALDVFHAFIGINDYTKELIKKQDINKIEELDDGLSVFQTIAMEKRLFPSSEDVLKNVNKKLLKREVIELNKGVNEQWVLK